MDGQTWLMIAFYIIVVGGGGLWTLLRGLKSEGDWSAGDDTKK